MTSSQRTSSSEEAVPPVVTDPERLRALRRYDLLDTDLEVELDHIAEWAADLFGAPVGVVNVIGEDWQWFASTTGIDSQKTGLEHSFCVYTLEQEAPMVVENLAEDERFSDHPFVQEEGGRFYVGAPVVTSDNQCLGTVFVLDHDPRCPSEGRVAQLQRLARMVVDELGTHPQTPEQLSPGTGVASQTDRRQDSLEHDRQMLEHAQQLASVGGWEYDVEREELEWTDETYRIHGVELGTPVDVEKAVDFYDPDVVPVLESNLERIIENGGRYDLELPIRTAEGERRWVRTIGVAHRREGETVRLTGAIQDITDRYEVQEELEEQKSVLRTIFDHAPVMIGLFDADGSLQLLNRQVEEVLGWSREHLADARDVLATLFPDPKYRTEIREFVQAPTGEWEEFRVRTSDDERIPIEVTTVELPDRRRIVIGIDVSQKRKRELRLRWAGRLVHLGYWAFDVETEALTWSTETRRIFGWDADADVTYERYLEAVHPEDRDRVNAVHQDALDGETEHDIEYRILRPSGEERVLRERGALRRDRHGRPISVVGAALDITEAAQRRRELREAKEEAEQADRMKTALLSNMNHEFRTPLTAIISFAKLIRDTPDRAEDFADRILGGGRRLLRTLNAVMDFAEVEGDQFDPTPQVHALGAAVESVMNDFQEKADRKGLHLEVDIPDDPVRVEVDPHYVKRICTHLVSNAVKFTDEGMVRATVERRREGATITIQDTGIGIPDAFLPHVYDEFAQASSGYDRTHDGNGIGLTIVKRFVDRIGGSIDIESEKGEGTQVTVQIPGGGRREPSGET